MLRSLQGTIRPLGLDRKTKCECCNEKHKKGYSVDIAKNYSLWFCEGCGEHIYNRCNERITEPAIVLDREQQYVHSLVMAQESQPVLVADYISLVIDNPELQHWTQQDRLECMRKLQNLGMIINKSYDCPGPMGMRESSMWDQSPLERIVQGAKGDM